jgi:exopolysaccharide biosynthesis polyprenyl glycosylphosphotransferase
MGRNRKKALIVGTGTRAKTLIDIVKNNFGWGLDIIGMLTGDENKVGLNFYGSKVIDHFDNIERVLKEINPEEVIFTISTKRFDQFRKVFEICEREGVQIRLNSDFFGYLTKDVRLDNVYGLNIISFSVFQQNEFELLIKRLIDIVGSLIAIFLFSPLMIIAAFGIMVSDSRPILYKWNVIGLNKKPFTSWKFRTMVKDADKIKEKLVDKNEMSGPVFKIANDPRIIPFGRWLRKFSIDETPQLFSVLKGDMSLVGPRPAFPHELVNYESWHRRKLSVKPGLTCLWQTYGRNNIKNFDEWIKMDLKYIDNWSLLLDIKILLKTIPSVIFGKGAS